MDLNLSAFDTRDETPLTKPGANVNDNMNDTVNDTVNDNMNDNVNDNANNNVKYNVNDNANTSVNDNANDNANDSVNGERGEEEEDLLDILHFTCSLNLLMLFFGGPGLYFFQFIGMILPHYMSLTYWLLGIDFVCFLSLAYIAFEYKNKVFMRYPTDNDNFIDKHRFAVGTWAIIQTVLGWLAILKFTPLVHRRETTPLKFFLVSCLNPCVCLTSAFLFFTACLGRRKYMRVNRIYYNSVDPRESLV